MHKYFVYGDFRQHLQAFQGPPCLLAPMAKSTTLDKEVLKPCIVTSLACITTLRYSMSAGLFTALSVRLEQVSNAVDPLGQVVLVAGCHVVRTAVTGATC